MGTKIESWRRRRREGKIESEDKVKGCRMVKVKGDKYYWIERQIETDNRREQGRAEWSDEGRVKEGLISGTRWKGVKWYY